MHTSSEGVELPSPRKSICPNIDLIFMDQTEIKFCQNNEFSKQTVTSDAVRTVDDP